MSRPYWVERFELAVSARENKAEEYLATLEKQYATAKTRIENEIAGWHARFAVNNKMTPEEATTALSKREMTELKWTLEDYIKRGEESDADGRWIKELENASAWAHIDRLTALDLKLRGELEILYGGELKGVTKLLGETYKDGYYGAAYEIQRGLGVGWDVALPDANRLDYVISNPWAQDGKVFSERIWSERDKLVEALQAELSENLIFGEPPDESIKRIAETFDVSEHHARRLVLTETAYAAAMGDLDAYKELGVEYFEFVATLDSATSVVCRETNGAIEPFVNYKPGVTAPPLHPNCRSTTVPAFEDEDGFKDKLAKGTDGKYYIPENETMPQWKKRFASGENAPKAIISGNFGGDTPRSKKELGEIAEKTHVLASKYTGKVGKWNGNIIYDPNEDNAKLWDCSIRVGGYFDDSVLLHEHLHARSASYADAMTYVENKGAEESAVQFLTREICAAEKIPVAASDYDEMIAALIRLNAKTGLYPSVIEFATEFFNIPLDKRLTWLYDVIKRGLGGNGSVYDYSELSSYVEMIRDYKR